MVTAGVTGGKTVPETVAANPLLFVTLTAPSFGPVHTAHEDGRRCHPRSRETACEHGQPTSCMAVHAPGDELVGAPLCQECYDTASAVVWQWWAPELWRRFTIALRRSLARTLGVAESRLGEVASVQYAKVAEYQRRGLVHFHALIRLDGPAAEGIGAPAPLDAAAARAGGPGRGAGVSRFSSLASTTTTCRVGCVGAGRSMCGSCDRGSAPTTRPGR